MLTGWCQCIDTEHRHKTPCNREVFYLCIVRAADGTEREVLWCGDCSDLYQTRATRERLSR